MFFIRADASPVIGMGHIMRCLAIAEELKALRLPVTFIVSNEFAKKVFEDHCMDYIVIPAVDPVVDEVVLLKDIFPELRKDVVLVDTYRATDEYLNELQKIAKVFFIDGLLKCNADISGLICFNPSAKPELYCRKYDGRNTMLLTGYSFVPLRAEFKTRNMCRKRGDGGKKSVLLTTGSTDNLHITESFCDIWQNSRLPELADLHVVVGKLFRDTDGLKPLDGITYHYNVTRMRPLMERSDLAVCQAGTTVYELLSQGVPTISFAVNEIQKTFSSLEPVIKWCGSIPDDCRDSQEPVREIIKAAEELIRDSDKLDSMAQQSCELFDGRGAERIAKGMQSCSRV